MSKFHISTQYCMETQELFLYERRLRGYRVTNGLKFFLQFFRIKWLRGYLGYRGYMGYDDPPSRGPVLIKFKVTRLQGYQWVEFFS